MLSGNNTVHENTSTPKRRRLGTGRLLRKSFRISEKEISGLQSLNTRPLSPFDKADDPPLPCNQIEYLCDSGNTSSTSCDIPCSPGVSECSIAGNTGNWGSLLSRDISKAMNEIKPTVARELDDIEDLSDDMFYSKLEQDSISQVNFNNNVSLLTSKCEKYFRENIEDSFALVNQSICDIKTKENDDKSSLFETKDSFLLDIEESSIIRENSTKGKLLTDRKWDSDNGFYGLPIMAKSLFKTYRNIEKFYNWQEECLELKAIKERRNLIYALPTSGGKTLVAEVLMLREVLNRKRNALFILPFVAIVQEKIWSLTPFAVQLDFLVEEYAAGKGHIPPKKRRKKNSVYVATIEKGLALVRSLIELGRLDEIGLIVVDELHLIGEPGRGATLEMLLCTVMFASSEIQIVGMSATIGNLPEVAQFLRAEVYECDFRPVALTEFVKLGDVLYRIRSSADGIELVPDRQLAFDYSAAGASLDPDWLGGLVAEVVPQSSCLIFCPTKRNCENVTTLLCKLQRREMLTHRAEERAALAAALRAEGAEEGLVRAVRCGLAFHHAGLASDERSLLEQAFRAGVVSALCCTSTLAAGVNLPAARVIVRAPRVGNAFISLAAYRQMAGRAGRAGVCDAGESIIICSERDWPHLRGILAGGLTAARSAMGNDSMAALALSGVGLGLAKGRGDVRRLLAMTLLATESNDDSPVDIDEICDEVIQSLIKCGALEMIKQKSANGTNATNNNNADSATKSNNSHSAASNIYHYGTSSENGNDSIKSSNSNVCANSRASGANCNNGANGLNTNNNGTNGATSNMGVIDKNTVNGNYENRTNYDSELNGINDQNPINEDYELAVSLLGKAAIKACVELTVAKQMLCDLDVASRSLVLMGGLHLLYLVTPHDHAGIRPDYRHYYSLYCDLDEESIQTAKILGITEVNAIRMMTGKPITNVPEKVLCRFYLALMLHDLWKQMPVPAVADKYIIPRGAVQSVLTSASAMACSCARLCGELAERWPFAALLERLATSLQHCAAPDLAMLMDLPNVKKARAMQLYRAGYKRVEQLARADVDALSAAVARLSRAQAQHLVSAARMLLIEKVENLRAEAEEVMDELNA